MQKFVFWRSIHRAILFGALLSMLLSACGSIQIEVERTPTPDLQSTATIQALQAQNKALEAQVATLVTPPQPPLTPGTDPETIRQRMLFSFNQWKTLWVEGETRSYLAEDTAQVTRVQVWISLPDAAFRLLEGIPQQGVTLAKISDGDSISELDAATGQIRRGTLPANARSAYNPPTLVDSDPTPHPLAAVLQNHLVDQLLPGALAQRAGSLHPVNMESVAGRDALVVEWLRPDETLSDRLWVDAATGVVLRRQEFSREDDAQFSEETIVESIQYDHDLPGGLFVTQIIEQPQFAMDYTGKPEARQPVTTTADPNDVAFGEVYFWVENSGFDYRLVRLPGSCLIKRGNCPEPDVLVGNPTPRGQVQPLLWAADGSAALLVEGEQPGRLYRYNPADESWLLLAEADFIYAAAWSPDNRYIAFSARRGAANDVFLLRPGGVASQQDETNLTQGKIAAPEDNLAHLAWLNPARLLVAASGPHGIRLHWVNIPLGQSKELMDLPVKGGLSPLPSPDGRYWALTEAQPGKTVLLTGVPLSSARQAASFSQASIWPLIWSPDSTWLGFVVNASSPLGSDPSTQADLYVIRPEGGGLLSLMRAPYIFSATWSPDSSALLAAADDGSGFTHLFVVPLDGSSVSIIQSPGLYLNTSWLSPSWRSISAAPTP